MGLSDYRNVEQLLRRALDQMDVAQHLLAKDRHHPELRKALRDATTAFDELSYVLDHVPLDAHTLVHLFVQVTRDRVDGLVDMADAVRADGDSVIRLPRENMRASGRS
jgi:hypothetical protein